MIPSVKTVQNRQIQKDRKQISDCHWLKEWEDGEGLFNRYRAAFEDDKNFYNEK